MKDKRKEMTTVTPMVQGLCDRVEALEKRLGQAGFSSLANTASLKCGSLLPKGELVFLFFILMEEEILFFDLADKKKNRSTFQDFIEKNFTYLGEGERQHDIARVSRHFSECAGFTYSERHLVYIEKIIALLISRERTHGSLVGHAGQIFGNSTIYNINSRVMKEEIKRKKQKRLFDALNMILDPLYCKMEEIIMSIRKGELRGQLKYYRNEDLKKIFGLSSNTIAKYRQTGILPFTKMGDIFLYDSAKIEKILKENSVGKR